VKTVDRATGRWRDILVRLGVEPRFLVNKHGPCPLCGGRDRFRWDDRDGSGSYYCSGCGPGPGLLLIRKLHGWNYATACGEVDKIIGSGAPRPTPAKVKDSPEVRLAAIERVLAEANSPEIVDNYLASRGLLCRSEALHGHPALAYHDDGGFRGRHPAVVAPVVGPGGEVQSAHRIYVADVPTRKKLMPAVATVKGAAVRLFDYADELGVAEGVETAMAAHQMFCVPTWATISAGGMEAFTPPAGLSKLIIFADNDSSFTGQRAGFALAHRLRRERPEIEVEVSIPSQPESDWLDVLNGDGR